MAVEIWSKYSFTPIGCLLLDLLLVQLQKCRVVFAVSTPHDFVLPRYCSLLIAMFHFLMQVVLLVPRFTLCIVMQWVGMTVSFSKSHFP